MNTVIVRLQEGTISVRYHDCWYLSMCCFMSVVPDYPLLTLFGVFSVSFSKKEKENSQTKRIYHQLLHHAKAHAKVRKWIIHVFGLWFFFPFNPFPPNYSPPKLLLRPNTAFFSIVYARLVTLLFRFRHHTSYCFISTEAKATR